jgi:hypothetical protein
LPLHDVVIDPKKNIENKRQECSRTSTNLLKNNGLCATVKDTKSAREHQQLFFFLFLKTKRIMHSDKVEQENGPSILDCCMLSSSSSSSSLSINNVQKKPKQKERQMQNYNKSFSLMPCIAPSPPAPAPAPLVVLVVPPQQKSEQRSIHPISDRIGVSHAHNTDRHTENAMSCASCENETVSFLMAENRLLKNALADRLGLERQLQETRAQLAEATSRIENNRKLLLQLGFITKIDEQEAVSIDIPVLWRIFHSLGQQQLTNALEVLYKTGDVYGLSVS